MPLVGTWELYFVAVGLALCFTHYIPGFHGHATKFLNKTCVILKIYCCYFLSVESSTSLYLAG